MTESIGIPPPKNKLSRHDFLKLGGVVTGVIVLRRYLDWTEQGRAPRETSHLNFEALEKEIYPVSAIEANNAEENIKKVMNGQYELDISDLEKTSEELLKLINDVQKIRNFAIFNSNHAYVSVNSLKTMIAQNPSADFNDNPLADWDQSTFKVNFKNVIKLEAYLSLRNLVNRGIAKQEDLQSINFNGWVEYPYLIGSRTDTHSLGSNFSHKKQIDEPLNFGMVDETKDNLNHTDNIIKTNWKNIKDAAERFGIDPFYIASIISMEARDQKTYYLYEQGDFKKPPLSLVLQSGSADTDENNPQIKRVLRVLGFINKHKALTQAILPDTLSEDTIDLLGAIAGQNTSLGPGQVNIDTANRFGLVELLSRRINEKIPESVLGVLLTNKRLNIMAIASYTRKLIDEYQRMQTEGLNLYLPDLTKYNPSKDCSNNKLANDPVYGENFGIAFFGGLYTSADYPEFSADKKDKYRTLRNLRFAPDIDNWGGWIGKYYEYYQQNKERLGLD